MYAYRPRLSLWDWFIILWVRASLPILLVKKEGSFKSYRKDGLLVSDHSSRRYPECLGVSPGIAVTIKVPYGKQVINYLLEINILMLLWCCRSHLLILPCHFLLFCLLSVPQDQVLERLHCHFWHVAPLWLVLGQLFLVSQARSSPGVSFIQRISQLSVLLLAFRYSLDIKSSSCQRWLWQVPVGIFNFVKSRNGRFGLYCKQCFQ